MKKVQFNKYFPQYKGENKCKDIIEWIKNEFRNRDKSKNRNKKIEFHLLNALDSYQVINVFRKCRESLQ